MAHDYDSLQDFVDKLDAEGGVEAMISWGGASDELAERLNEFEDGLGTAWQDAAIALRTIDDAIADLLP